MEEQEYTRGQGGVFTMRTPVTVTAKDLAFRIVVVSLAAQ